MSNKYTNAELVSMWERTPQEQYDVMVSKIIEAINLSNGKIFISWSGGSLSSYGLYGDTDYCYAAIDYYLIHSDEYTWQHSWRADGTGITNYFY